MITLILVAVATVLIVFAVAVSRQPSTFHIARSVTVDAPASVIFPHVNASRAWEPWSPWIRVETTSRYSYEGPSEGVGAVTRFTGRKVGAGVVTIVESRPYELVRFRLDMTRPFRGSNDVRFTFVEARGQTTVTWSMSGGCPFVAKAMRVFIDCDAMCGRHFADGLNNLKQHVEKLACEAQSTIRV